MALIVYRLSLSTACIALATSAFHVAALVALDPEKSIDIIFSRYGSVSLVVVGILPIVALAALAVSGIRADSPVERKAWIPASAAIVALGLLCAEFVLLHRVAAFPL